MDGATIVTRYFKNQVSQLFVDPIVDNHANLTEIYAAEFNAILLVNQTPTQAELDAQRVQEIENRLTEIDLESIRALRATARGQSTQFDINKLDTLEAEAELLRTELAGLA